MGFREVSKVSYLNEMGWSSERSVPRLVRPGRNVVTPAAITIGWLRECTLPRAIVPSWQLRHNLLEPVGWPGVAFKELLAYGL